MNPFPFFVGVGRSGTTLVRAIFDSHPEMAVPGESHFIPRMARERRRYESGAGVAVGAFLNDVAADPWFRRWELPPGRLAEALSLPPPLDLPGLIRRLYAVYAARRGKSRYADKTPAYVLHLPALARLFPEARVIHIVRDGRDVALSHLDVEFRSWNVERLALMWRKKLERGRRAGRSLGPGRYLEVRYEDLVADPEGTVRSLCGFVGVGFDDAMLRYHERAAEVIRPVPHPAAHRNLYLPPTRGLRDWRRDMRREDVALFEVLAGDLLTSLGYELSAERPRPRDRLGARARQLRAEGGRLGHALRKRLRPARARS